jgi:4-hydroxybenzoate polyprenyltransferase
MSTDALSISTVWTNLRGLARAMRPSQWTKNAIVFAALVFDGKLLQPDLLLRTTLIAICFCLVSSSVYLMNDLVDIEKDRQHPRKRLRPLPSGELAPAVAATAAVLLGLVGVATATWVNVWAGVVTAVYLLQNVAYSF